MYVCIRQALRTKQPEIAYVILRQVFLGQQKEGYLDADTINNNGYNVITGPAGTESSSGSDNEPTVTLFKRPDRARFMYEHPAGANGCISSTYNPCNPRSAGSNDRAKDSMFISCCARNVYLDTETVDEIIDDLCYVRKIDEAADIAYLIHTRQLGCDIYKSSDYSTNSTGVFGSRGFSDLAAFDAGYVGKTAEVFDSNGTATTTGTVTDAGYTGNIHSSSDKKRWIVQPSGATFGTIAVAAGRSFKPEIMMRMLKYVDDEMKHNGLVCFSEHLFIALLNICAYSGYYQYVHLTKGFE